MLGRDYDRGSTNNIYGRSIVKCWWDGLEDVRRARCRYMRLSAKTKKRGVKAHDGSHTRETLSTKSRM